jgi:adenylosuccinate synthase
MKAKKIFTATDLGGGDGGKGGVVHKICCQTDAHTVLKMGGAQGSHGVRTSRGETFNFSQFGCGTFEGVRTHITRLMVTDPLGLLHEGDELRFSKGISNVYDLLTVDEDCLCNTPYHGIASRLRELARKEHQKGTVGVGIGEAKYDSEVHPELAIYMRDMKSPDLRKKLERVRDQKIEELKGYDIEDLWEVDRVLARKEMSYLFSQEFLDWTTEQFQRVGRQVRIVYTQFLERDILSREGSVVVESSHGILTDKYHGFHPFVSRLRTLPQAMYDLLKERGYDGQIIKLGVTRAYQIRHGAGPMVTESNEMLEGLLPGSSKDENRWQGKVRVGALDFVTLRYAVGVCGGPSSFDGIAVTWFDQVQKNGVWNVCYKYKSTDDEFFSPEGEILTRNSQDETQINHQSKLAQKLFKTHPDITSLEANTEVCCETVQSQLGIPVRMISLGPTEDDKLCI